MHFKKSIASLFLFLMLFSNLGLAINMHYCEDVLSKVTFSTSDLRDACEHDETNADQSCCLVGEDHEDCCTDSIVTPDIKELVSKQHQISIDSFVAVITTSCFEWNSLFPTVLGAKKEFFFYEVCSNAPPLFDLFSQRLFYS